MSCGKRISDFGFRISGVLCAEQEEPRPHPKSLLSGAKLATNHPKSDIRNPTSCLSLLLLLCVGAHAADTDVMLRAMRAELDRARNLKFDNLESPYYVEANVDDVNGFTATATLGGLLSA